MGEEEAIWRGRLPGADLYTLPSVIPLPQPHHEKKVNLVYHSLYKSTTIKDITY